MQETGCFSVAILLAVLPTPFPAMYVAHAVNTSGHYPLGVEIFRILTQCARVALALGFIAAVFAIACSDMRGRIMALLIAVPYVFYLIGLARLKFFIEKSG